MTLDKLNQNPRARYDLDFSDLHEHALNFDTRSGDRVFARVRSRDDAAATFVDMRVWDTSERAIELVYPVDSQKTWSKGEAVDLEVRIAGQRMLFEGLIVDQIRESDATRRIGIRYARRVEQWSQHERRVGPRWVCSDQFYPSCIATSPFVSGGATVFQVKDVSSEGMQLVCDISRTYLIPKMRVRLTVNFPLVGDFVTPVEIVRIGFDSQGGKDLLSVGVKFIQLTDEMRVVIAQYLIEFSNVPSLQALKDSGFRPPQPKRGIEFYFAKSEEDIREVWQLRKVAHLNDHNIADESLSDEDMSDRYDMVSRIVVGKHNGRIVATARAHFGSLDYPLEHETYVEWPKELPRRDEIMEISRVALHPEFQKADLLMGLFQYVVMTFREERPFVLLSAWPDQAGMYTRLGFSDTGLRYKAEIWTKEIHVLMGDGLAGLCGKNINPLVWNLTWRPAAERMIRSGVISPMGMNKFRFQFYKLFAWPARILERLSRGPKKKKIRNK